MDKTLAQAFLAFTLIGLIAAVAEAQGTPLWIWLLETALAIAVFILGLER